MTLLPTQIESNSKFGLTTNKSDLLDLFNDTLMEFKYNHIYPCNFRQGIINRVYILLGVYGFSDLETNDKSLINGKNGRKNQYIKFLSRGGWCYYKDRTYQEHWHNGELQSVDVFPIMFPFLTFRKDMARLLKGVTLKGLIMDNAILEIHFTKTNTKKYTFKYISEVEPVDQRTITTAEELGAPDIRFKRTRPLHREERYAPEKLKFK